MTAMTVLLVAAVLFFIFAAASLIITLKRHNESGGFPVFTGILVLVSLFGFSICVTQAANAAKEYDRMVFGYPPEITK